MPPYTNDSAVAPIQQTPDQYEVQDPLQQSAQPAPTVAPTPDGQMPPQPSQPAPQTSNPNVNTQAGQPQSLQSAPAGSTATPAPIANPHTNRLLASARAIMAAMTPGPMYRTSIDPNTGETSRVEQPVSGRSLGLAIALEAITGGLSGAAARGPNATGQAAAAGLQQGQQIAQAKQQAQTQLDQQAQQDLVTKFQTLKNNLSLMTQARALSKADEQDHIDAEAQARPLYEAAKNEGAIVADNLEDAGAMDGKRYPSTDYDRYLVGHRVATDQNGNQIYMIPGSGRIVPEGTPGAVPKYVNQWAIADRHKFTLGEDGGNLPFIDSQIARGGLLANGPMRGQLTSVQAQMLQVKDAVTNAAMSDINRVRAEQGQAPVNLDPVMRKNGSLQDALGLFQTQLGVNGHQYMGALQAVQAKFPESASTIAAAYGGPAALQAIDLRTAQHDQDNKFRTAGVSDDKEANAALNSTSPDVKAMGTAYFANKRAQKKQDEQDAENIRIGGEESVERFKANLAANAGGPDSPAANAAPNAQGVRADYLNSLPATVRNQVQAIGEGRQAPPSRASKQGIDLMNMVTTAYPSYNGANFATYQAAKTKSTSGKTGEGITALNTAIDHVAEMSDNATLGGTLPGVGAIERGLGNQKAQNFKTAQTAAAEEVNKAIKGGVLGVEEGNRALSDIQGWTPISVKAKSIALLNLLKDRLDEQQSTLNTASVTGVAPFTLMSPKARRNYERLTGDSAPDSATTPVVPAGMIPGRDASGNVIGYKDPTTGKVTKF